MQPTCVLSCTVMYVALGGVVSHSALDGADKHMPADAPPADSENLG